MTTVRQILSAMAYREMADRKWLKPIGFSLLAYDEANHDWACWIPVGPITSESPELKHGLWCRRKLKFMKSDGDLTQQSKVFLYRLKLYEAYEIKAKYAGPTGNSDMHLAPDVHYALEIL